MAIALDAGGDLALNSSGLPHFIGGAQAAAQRLRVRLGFFRGEWFRDTRLGVPYFQAILGKRVNLVLIRSIFRQVILDVPGIVALDRLTETFDRPSRTLRPVFTARYEDGTAITEQVLGQSWSPVEAAL